ncbi:MAG: DUF418 domain-containing protein [Spirochaeta sp.]|nr:DUF418 domain-containing protein [Spirochaeta sp.]
MKKNVVIPAETLLKSSEDPLFRSAHEAITPLARVDALPGCVVRRHLALLGGFVLPEYSVDDAEHRPRCLDEIASVGRIDLWVGFLLAVLLYLLQIPLSGWWFRRFRFGPLEWLWRVLTCGRLPRS